MAHQPVSSRRFTVTTAGGIGGYTSRLLTGKITRVRIIPPSAGAYKSHIEDDEDGVMSLPSDGRSLDGTSVIEVTNGEVDGQTDFYVDNTSINGEFKFRVWGYFRPYA